jgi:hypothetical protein
MVGKVPKVDPKIQKKLNKEYALKAVREIFPDVKFHATKRSKVPHDGMYESALIAEYGRRKWQV